MRIPSITDNGNVALDNLTSFSSQDICNGSYLEANDSSINCCIEDNVLLNSNYQNSFHNTVDNGHVTIDSKSIEQENLESKVCNKQYILNNQNIDSILINKEDKIRTENRQSNTSWQGNDSTDSTPEQEERAFEQSDSDEMSDKSVHPVPRGIVNPNYPGFQHLAHTLQDYSSHIGSSYHSENDMTDDDLDIEISESSLHNINGNHNEQEIKNINNNKNQESAGNTKFKNVSLLKIDKISTRNDVPDLLKTISQNNNNIESNNYDFNCTATDIENNFHTKDIIGDFNKEIEDEIRQLLNYNINIEDDLQELRKDIKDTLAKPIENTINNISEVVNHVIKKLVETDGSDKHDAQSPDFINDHDMEDITDMDKENKTNTRTEMNISRPTFLLIENNIDNKIKDAILSDGKDEINICEDEYDTEQLNQNIENTIKQLSTELRKIIPKLNEMRERDKLWCENKKDIIPVITDGNSNNIIQGSICCTGETSTHLKPNIRRNITQEIHLVPSSHQRLVKAYVEPKVRHSLTKSMLKAQNITSVRKNVEHKESDFESFDVYNIETALPKLDLDAIENHIKAAKEAERRKRNDREEIRKRLAMGVDSEEYYSLGHIDRPGKKPSLHSRLQNGKNLQICFMNETASDNESQASDIEKNFNCNSKNSSRSSLFRKNSFDHPYITRPLSVNITKNDKNTNTPGGAKLRPTSLTLKSSKSRSTHSLGHIELKESDFFALQATLQTEARIALAQAKEMARIQMERERRARAVSPVTEMLQHSMEKANAPLAPDRRRVSRHLLTDMNIAQLQVIVNELHSQIESLNDSLVKLLMARDELHMGQDSMLVDIEDLTRYLGVKEQTKKTKGTPKSGVRRLTSLVHK